MGRPKGSKNKTTPIKSVAKLDNDDKVLYRKLTDYIQDVYLRTVGYEPPWALFMTQIKDIKKNYGINYDEILQVLKYMIQFEEIDITNKDTLGLIPYYVDKTNKFVNNYKVVRSNIKDFEYNEQTIVIKPIQQSQRKHKKNEVFD